MAPAFRTSVGLALATLVSAYGCVGSAPLRERAPIAVEVDPVVFVGMVEVVGDQRGVGVLLSTATEEVVIADNAIAERLMQLEGEIVAAEGRLIEAGDGPPTMIVRAFRVLGAARAPSARTATAC